MAVLSTHFFNKKPVNNNHEAKIFEILKFFKNHTQAQSLDKNFFFINILELFFLHDCGTT